MRGVNTIRRASAVPCRGRHGAAPGAAPPQVAHVGTEALSLDDIPG
jgi:hypothetical protein